MLVRYTFITFLLSLICASYAYGQNDVTGKILENKSKPIPFVNVILRKELDSSLVKGSISNDSGKFEFFSIPNGNYFINISSVGFRDNVINFSLEGKPLNLGNIILEEYVEELNEVIVEQRKPLYQQKNDRIIVNVKNSIASGISSVFDMLNSSPGVLINKSQSTISLNGKEGVIIMINGKIVRQPPSSIILLLEGMSSQNIEKIELLTNPPAKYDAAGNGGIINIVLTENPNLGFNGEASGTFGYGKRDKESLGFNMNYRNQDLLIYAGITYNRNRTQESVLNSRSFPDRQTSSFIFSERNPVTNNVDGQIGFDLKLSDKTYIGGLASGYRNNWKMDAFNSGSSFEEDMETIRFESDNSESNVWSNLLLNFNVSHDITNSSTIDFDIDYLVYDNDNPTNYQNTIIDLRTDTTQEQTIRASKNTPIDILVTSLDYSKSFKNNSKLDLGFKGTFSNLNNIVEITDSLVDDQTSIEDLNENSNLDENILALYSSLFYPINKNWELQLGLRYESTILKLNSEIDGNILDLNYDNLFPTFFMNYKLNEKTKANLSYGKRINRPSYNDLAPFIIFLDPETFYNGNTSLQPSLSDNIKLGLQTTKTIISLEFNKEQNAISTFEPIILENGNQLFTSINLDFRRLLSLSVSRQLRLTNWWQGSINVSGFLGKIRTTEGISLNTNYVRANTSQTFNLGKNYNLEISGNFQSKYIIGRSTWGDSGNISLGFEKKFNNNSKLRFSFTNILNNRFFNFTSEDLNANFFIRTDYNYEPRVLRLGYNYIFGNSSLKKKKERQIKSKSIKDRIN